MTSVMNITRGKHGGLVAEMVLSLESDRPFVGSPRGARLIRHQITAGDAQELGGLAQDYLAGLAIKSGSSPCSRGIGIGLADGVHDAEGEVYLAMVSRVYNPNLIRLGRGTYKC